MLREHSPISKRPFFLLFFSLPKGDHPSPNDVGPDTQHHALNDCLAPCQQTCPAQIDIPTYIEHINEGRYVADVEMNSGRHYKVPVAPDTGYKVAIVGGEPAGLTCAYYLRRLGHSPVIFESMPQLGSMLRYGIPEYRLPKKVLDSEIQGILDLGIEARTNVQFGRDFDLEYLLVEGTRRSSSPRAPGTPRRCGSTGRMTSRACSPVRSSSSARPWAGPWRSARRWP